MSNPTEQQIRRDFKAENKTRSFEFGIGGKSS
jgi:hypothetical protein